MKRASSIAFAVLLLSTAAAAQSGDKALAKEAYDRGTVAHARGDFRRAAEEFARADALAPSPVALQAALDAAVDADAPELGAELLDRSKRARPTGALVTSIEAAMKKLGGRAGHLKVACPSGARCTSQLDGAPFDSVKGAWVRIGTHDLVVEIDGSLDKRRVEVRAGDDLEIVPARASAATVAPLPRPAPVASTGVPAPAPTAPPVTEAEPPRKPLPPIAVIAGIGVTVLFAGAATYYGIRAGNKHDDFVSAGCGVLATSACAELKDDGERVQRFANIGFGVAAAAGVASVVIGLFLTDWGRTTTKAGRAPVVVPVPGGFAGGYSVRF